MSLNGNDPDQDLRKDVVCRCSGTTAAQIKRLVDRGVTDLDGLSRATGACSGCGSCDCDILALVAEYARPVWPDVG